MKPGLSRAVPAAILGFLGSLAFVFILRGLQGVEPLFDPGIGFSLAAFVSSFAFIWGMGGSDPRMSQHPHEPEVDAETGLIIVSEEEADEEEEPDEYAIIEQEAHVSPPMRTLGFSMWQVSYWVLGLFVVLFGFATLPTGLYLRTTSDPQASTTEVGYYAFTLPFGGPEVQMSQLTAFVVMSIFVLVTLAVIGGGLALLFTSLSRNVQEVQAEEPTRLSYVPEETVERKPWMRDLIIVGSIIFVYMVLFHFMETGIGWSLEINLLLIVISAAIGIWLTGRRTQDPSMDDTDKWIEAIKVNSMIAGLIFIFPTLYIIHYEVLVGFVFPTEWIQVTLSLGASIAATLSLTFVFFNDTVSSMIINSARSLRANLQEPEPLQASDAPALEGGASDAPRLEAPDDAPAPATVQTAEASEA